MQTKPNSTASCSTFLLVSLFIAQNRIRVYDDAHVNLELSQNTRTEKKIFYTTFMV